MQFFERGRLSARQVRYLQASKKLSTMGAFLVGQRNFSCSRSWRASIRL